MKDKATYLCGGINGLTDIECKSWREVSKEHLLTNTIDPMRRDYRGVEDTSVDEIVLGDLRDISHSDYVLVNATKPSWGTAMEIVYARNRKLPIVAFTGDSRISPWLRYHCNSVCPTLAEAISTINGMYRS